MSKSICRNVAFIVVVSACGSVESTNISDEAAELTLAPAPASSVELQAQLADIDQALAGSGRPTYGDLPDSGSAQYVGVVQLDSYGAAVETQIVGQMLLEVEFAEASTFDGEVGNFIYVENPGEDASSYIEVPGAMFIVGENYDYVSGSDDDTAFNSFMVSVVGTMPDIDISNPINSGEIDIEFGEFGGSFHEDGVIGYIYVQEDGYGEVVSYSGDVKGVLQ